jgi:hypothetical protein
MGREKGKKSQITQKSEATARCYAALDQRQLIGIPQDPCDIKGPMRRPLPGPLIYQHLPRRWLLSMSGPSRIRLVTFESQRSASRTLTAREDSGGHLTMCPR